MVVGDGSQSAFADLLRRYLAHEFEHTVINISLSVVAGAIALSIVLSLLFPPRRPEPEPDEAEQALSDAGE
jgi:hypothetical protein